MTIQYIVRIVAGLFRSAFLVLGAPGSPFFHGVDWLWLATFVGADRFQSDFTRFCPLEILLKKMDTQDTGP
jgi:hypothetical protein